MKLRKGALGLAAAFALSSVPTAAGLAELWTGLQLGPEAS